MNTAEKIFRNVEQFPDVIQAEVLDFVLFLQQKNRLNVTTLSSDERRNKLREVMIHLQQSNVFSEIENPASWQREVRADRTLPGREC
ncbi:MAG: hypothetical protein PHF56_18710 [Desulfuromonadaceae bacterium]|nr:hypothetical protein [Desulfuromonadaceae bacterium]